MKSHNHTEKSKIDIQRNILTVWLKEMLKKKSRLSQLKQKHDESDWKFGPRDEKKNLSHVT